MIIRRSLTPLNYSRTLRAVRRRETVRRSDDNSRWKVQNVRGASCDKRVNCHEAEWLHPIHVRQARLVKFGAQLTF
jgi:hypothetical protein